MLVAIDKDSGERLESLRFNSGHEIRMNYPNLQCPFCESGLFPRDRKDYLLHFVHKHTCTTKFEHHPESLEHLKGKTYLAKILSRELSKCGFIDVCIEYPIPEAGKNGRIADVAAVYPTGYLLVYECQLAAITTDQLQRRTDDYANAGADVIWWLGKEARTDANKEWCLEHFGKHYELNFSREVSHIQYSDRESLLKAI